MLRKLHQRHELSDHSITYMLAKNIRIEEDFIDQLFNSTEKRLAHAPATRPLRAAGPAAARAADDLVRHAGGEDRDDSSAREVLYEQVPQTGLCRGQPRPADQ
jgi:hypothetical protein